MLYSGECGFDFELDKNRDCNGRKLKIKYVKL